MDVDGDVDWQLLQQFSSMATTDKEVLIAEFQRLLGNRISPTDCAFFLDMNNWNLQAAICSYFEYDQPAFRPPQMSFVKDITIGEGESVTPNTKFTKTWRMQNTGDEPWPAECALRFVAGEQFGPHSSVPVKALRPGEMLDVSVEMISPVQPGIHQGQWKMCTINGLYFGEFIWVILQVEEGGVLAVTQLLSQFGGDMTLSNGTSNDQFSRSAAGADNPFMPMIHASNSFTSVDAGGGASELLSPITSCNGGARHSSLPSSPRWFGEDRGGSVSSGPVPICGEALRARTVLFQTPDNSPSKTISSGSGRPTLFLPTILPSSSDVDTMET